MRFKQIVLVLVVATAAAWAAVSVVGAAEPTRIVGFGDSLMAGYGLNPGESFPEKLAAKLTQKGHDVVMENAGVSGDTTSAGLARLDWSIPDGTDIVILELGANDMLRGVTPEITRRNLDQMLGRLKQRGISVVLAGMQAAPNLGPDYKQDFDAIYPDLASKYGVPLYPFFLDGVAADRSLLLEDGMHPSAEGVDRMVAGFLPTIEPLIAAQAAD